MHSVSIPNRERPQEMFGLIMFRVTHQIHIDTIRVGPQMVKTFQEAESQWVRNVMEMNELLDFCHLTVVAGLCGVQLSDNCTHIAKYTGIH